MNLLQYIQGFRKGKDAHHLEREAMQNPFLADALDGYDKVKGNHLPEIEKLRKQILQKTQAQQTSYWRYWGIAASILVVLGLGGYWFLLQPNLPNEPMIAAQIPPTKMEEPIVETEAITISELEMLAQNKETIRFTPPVIVKEEEVVDDNRMQAEIQASEPTEPVFLAEPTLTLQNDSKLTLATGTGSPKFSITLPIDTGKPMLIAMNESKEVLSEVVVVGYGTQKKSALAGAVAKISAKRESFDDYVKKSLIHPTDGECKDVKGNVTLRFYVDENGHPYDIKVKKSLCPSADKEAIRLLEHGPDWKVTEKEMTKKISF